MQRISVPDAVEQLLSIVELFSRTYEGRKQFTLDGRLVGDLGEVLVEERFQVALLPGLARKHDAKATDGTGRLVQIKATMKESLTFPARSDHIPDYLIGVRILRSGSIDVIFNGPGMIAARAVERRSPTPTHLHSVSISCLAKLQKAVSLECQIPERLDDLLPLSGVRGGQ